MHQLFFLSRSLNVSYKNRRLTMGLFSCNPNCNRKAYYQSSYWQFKYKLSAKNFCFATVEISSKMGKSKVGINFNKTRHKISEIRQKFYKILQKIHPKNIRKKHKIRHKNSQKIVRISAKTYINLSKIVIKCEFYDDFSKKLWRLLVYFLCHN